MKIVKHELNSLEQEIANKPMKEQVKNTKHESEKQMLNYQIINTKSWEKPSSLFLAKPPPYYR